MLASVMPLFRPRIREIESARILLQSLSNRNLFFCAITFVRRANEMRFHMLAANQKLIAMMREAGIATHLYTNDADQNLCLRGKGGEDLPFRALRRPNKVAVHDHRKSNYTWKVRMKH
jgi:hypothetical protein